MDQAIQPNGIKPEASREPTAEEKSFKFEVDPSILNSAEAGNTVITDNKGNDLKETPAEIKTEEAAPVKEKKEVAVKETPKEEKKSVLTPPKEEKAEVTSEPKPTKAETTKLGIKPITLPGEKKQEQDAFDYTGYSPQEVTNLKNMSRQSREYVAGLIKEQKELSKLKDSTYLQHEEAYVLNPEFKQLQGKVYEAKTEGQAWETALIAIKAGKEFQEPVGRDPKTGALIFGKPRQADDRDEIRISQNLNACVGALNQSERELQNYPQQFKGRIQQDMQFIHEVRKAQFAWQNDPKLLEYSLEVEGQGQQKIKDVISNFKNLWPTYLRNSVAVDTAADLMVALMIRTSELDQAQKGRGVAEIKQTEAARGEPSSDAYESEENPNRDKRIPKTFSLAGFPSGN